MNHGKQSSSAPLPGTLAQRVQYFRERRMLTREALARLAHLSVEYVTDVESGLEMFLSPAIRQRLARVLQVRAEQLREVEKPPSDQVPRNLQQECLALMERMRRQPDADYDCPVCGATLETRQFERRDLENNPILVVKTHCSQCLFRLALD